MNHTQAIKKAVKQVGGQTALAALIGVSQGLVWQWVQGARITTRHFAAIEKAAGVSVQELLADEMSKSAQYTKKKVA